MTAKEALLQRVQSLTEEQAEALLRELPVIRDASEPNGASVLDKILEIWADVPEEEWDDVPTSEHVDRVVYGTTGQK